MATRLPVSNEYRTGIAVKAAVKELERYVIAQAGEDAFTDAPLVGRSRIIKAPEGIWALGVDGLSFHSWSGPEGSAGSDTLELRIEVRLDPSQPRHAEAPYCLVTLNARPDSAHPEAMALKEHLDALWGEAPLAEPSTRVDSQGKPLPTWVPKTEDCFGRWQEAYQVMLDMNEDWREDTYDYDDVRPPTLAEYRDRMRAEIGWAPSTKTVGRIKQAGGKGWLR